MALPPSSPRLPSPPPPAEDQIGPKSPGLDTPASRQAQQIEQSIVDANAKRRIHPGTKSENMAAGPPLVPLNELDSAFQLQEHLAALHYHHTASNTRPITRQTATLIGTAPPGIDTTLWLYELCRFLIAQCNSVIVGFLFDSPPCSQATCPEMRASEWQFLCAVHDQPKSCCAIDYCCHTLDWAATVVTNPKLFPSRFVVLSEGHDKMAVLKSLVNVFRRLHRIFAHAWFQHRGVFWNVETQTGLYVFFKTVCDIYDLLPAENFKLPPEAEGLEPTLPEKEESQPKITAIAKPPPRENGGNFQDDDERSNLHARRSNTARHSSRPSTGSAVTTVIEEREDENSAIASKMRELHISAPETVEEESEVEVPVIVEGQLLNEPEDLRQGVRIDVQETEPIDEGNTEEGRPLETNTHEGVELPSSDHEQELAQIVTPNEGDSVDAPVSTTDPDTTIIGDTETSGLLDTDTTKIEAQTSEEGSATGAAATEGVEES
ncbi:Mob1/phocein [Xylariales sp. PMI_506]|nr:Mob1/phocein [Xylariales sp. PMI_506]